VAGLVTTLGSGAMNNSIKEIDGAATIFVIGANTTSAHPVIGQRMRRAAQNGATLIVINPKETDLAQVANHYIQHKSGSDVALLMGMCRYIIEEDLHDKAYITERCENFDEFQESLATFTPEYVEEICGVPWEQVATVARTYATHKPAALFFAMGITQHTHGTEGVMAVSNLALLTGNIGKPSSGVNPLRGQNNVQGACDMGGLPNYYPGYQQVTDPAVREKFEKAWEIGANGAEPKAANGHSPISHLSDKIGLTHTEIFDKIYEGEVTALYMVGENPLLTEANAKHVRASLEKLDFFVAQDLFISETAAYADVILPAASFAEKDGTFTNTERRVQRVRQAIAPRGDSRPDWWIVCQIAQEMGAAGFDFAEPSQIMDEIAAVTPSYGGISHERVIGDGLQWPCPTADHPGTQYLHKDKFARPNGKAQFVPLSYRESAEVADDEYPLILSTDRSLYHYHSATMTRRVEGLEKLDSNEWLKLSPADAAQFDIENGEWVEVHSRRGKVKVRAQVTDICPPGFCSMTFHFHETPTNEITSGALDPVAKIPETKVAAVRVEKIESSAGVGEEQG
jgi:formate dehydrogenase major subunit